MNKSPTHAVARLETGELYLFHISDPTCPAASSLWGVFDYRKESKIFLETSSFDLMTFRYRHPLPASYRFLRLATRTEAMDYMYNLGAWEESRNSPT